jgi:hypothetical protein
MNFSKIFWGIFILLLGVFILFEHLELFHIHWWYLLHFWPVLIILWGVTILPIKNNIKLVISIALVIFTILTIAYISNKRPDYFKKSPGMYFRNHNNNDEEWDDPYFDADSNTTDI